MWVSKVTLSFRSPGYVKGPNLYLIIEKGNYNDQAKCISDLMLQKSYPLNGAQCSSPGLFAVTASK